MGLGFAREVCIDPETIAGQGTTTTAGRLADWRRRFMAPGKTPELGGLGRECEAGIGTIDLARRLGILAHATRDSQQPEMGMILYNALNTLATYLSLFLTLPIPHFHQMA